MYNSSSAAAANYRCQFALVSSPSVIANSSVVSTASPSGTALSVTDLTDRLLCFTPGAMQAGLWRVWVSENDGDTFQLTEGVLTLMGT